MPQGFTAGALASLPAGTGLRHGDCRGVTQAALQPGQRQGALQSGLGRGQALQQRVDLQRIDRTAGQAHRLGERLGAGRHTLTGSSQADGEAWRQADLSAVRAGGHVGGQYAGQVQAQARVRVGHHQAGLAAVVQHHLLALICVGQVVEQALEQGLGGQLHLASEAEDQRTLQQRHARRLRGVNIQHALPVLRRQLDGQRTAGVPVGVVGVGGEEGVSVLALAPPGEGRLRTGHLHQAQAAVLHD